MSEINHIIQNTVMDDSAWGPLYTRIADLLHGDERADPVAALAEARQTNRYLNRRAQAAEAVANGYKKAVREWRIRDKGTYVPYDSLKKIGRLAGLEILPDVRYMQRFENAQQAEEFIEQLYKLLEYWSTISAPPNGKQEAWWEKRLAELSKALNGGEVPGPQELLRAQVKEALSEAGIKQVEVARRLNLSAKHVSQMLTGKMTLTLGWAERILALCGQRLEIRTVSAIPKDGEEK
jgi:transcriptional regulator with XRE-family HTH domain